MDPTPPSKIDVMRTLVAAGFTIRTAESKTNYFTALASRTDILAVPVTYLIAVAAGGLSQADFESLRKTARIQNAHLVVVADAAEGHAEQSVLTYAQFTDRLGGEVLSLLPLEPAYAERLHILGTNQCPPGLVGRPDELFETYVHAGFQFIFGSRVVRYGQDRRGEEVPDGISFSSNAPLCLYDAKASEAGFEMSADADRQFAQYVDAFHRSHSHRIGRLRTFVVVSSSFADPPESLERRSRKLQAACQVPLAFMDSATLGAAVGALVQQPLLRRSIDWGLVLARVRIELKDVLQELRRLQKDRVET